MLHVFLNNSGHNNFVISMKLSLDLDSRVLSNPRDKLTLSGQIRDNRHSFSLLMSHFTNPLTPTHVVHVTLTHIRLVALEVGKLSWLRGLDCQLLLGHHGCCCLARQGRSVNTQLSLRHRWLPHGGIHVSILLTIDSLILLWYGLVRRSEGVRLEQRSLVTLLISRADGVRSVRYWWSGHSLMIETQ